MLVVKRFYHVVIHDEMSQPNYPPHVEGQNELAEGNSAYSSLNYVPLDC